MIEEELASIDEEVAEGNATQEDVEQEESGIAAQLKSFRQDFFGFGS